MNAMTNFTLKSLRANKVRTLVTVAGVALAAALLTAVLTTYASLNDYLYRSEEALAGTWMARVEAEGDSAATEVDAVAEDPGVTGVAALTDVGFAELTAVQQERQGLYVPIRSFAGDIGNLCAIQPSEGRLPERAGEIMLFATWQTYGGLHVGDEVTFNVGQRVAVAAPDADAETAEMEAGWGFAGEETAPHTIEDGTPLNSSMGYLQATPDGAPFNEELVNVEPRTYTVVGFYNRSGYALSSSVGMAGLTVADGANGSGGAVSGSADVDTSAAYTDIYLAFSGVADAQQVSERAEALFPDDHIVLHTAMLRYMGISDDSTIWSTFYGIVLVLAAVIVIACVSLIFNAFNISVAERVKQFGLLSSVGASRRQLRRAVVLEGALVACAGIPLGLVVGLAGCAATFAALGPSIAQVMGDVGVAFRVVVNGAALGVAAALTLVTVLVSVWIPAKRASRTNVIDALRSASSVRVIRRGAARAAKCTETSRLWKARGVMDRLFGVGGVLARVNRQRGTGKGRAASVSLALAIVLLMTAGSLNVFLGTLVDVAGGGEVPGEVGVTAQFSFKNAEEAQGTTGEAAPDGANSSEAPAADAKPSEPATPESLMAADDALLAEEADLYTRAFDYLSATPNAQPVGWKLSGGVDAVLPESMVGEAFREDGCLNGGPLADGSYGTVGSVTYLDDAAFDAYAESVGQNPADYRDPSQVRAIALAKGYGNDGSVYQLTDVLRAPGTIEVLAAATYQGEPVDGFALSYDMTAEGGAPTYRFMPFMLDDSDAARGIDELSLDDVEVARVPVEIAAITDEAPALVAGPGEGLQLFLPMSAASFSSLGSVDPVFYAYFDAADGDHGALSEELATRGSEFFHDQSPYELAFYSYNDYLEQQDSARMLATIVNVFCLLFTVILALIAMANVFNTVTNSLILRRREFAVMKSVGLSDGQFRRLIADECAHFGIAGLVPGLIISAGVAWLLWVMVAQSMRGLGFMLPWGYVALSVALTAAAMGISVAYGMHRCRADSVVEALRADAV